MYFILSIGVQGKPVENKIIFKNDEEVEEFDEIISKIDTMFDNFLNHLMSNKKLLKDYLEIQMKKQQELEVEIERLKNE